MNIRLSMLKVELTTELIARTHKSTLQFGGTKKKMASGESSKSAESESAFNLFYTEVYDDLFYYFILNNLFVVNYTHPCCNTCIKTFR